MGNANCIMSNANCIMSNANCTMSNANCIMSNALCNAVCIGFNVVCISFPCKFRKISNKSGTIHIRISIENVMLVGHFGLSDPASQLNCIFQRLMMRRPAWQKHMELHLPRSQEPMLILCKYLPRSNQIVLLFEYLGRYATFKNRSLRRRIQARSFSADLKVEHEHEFWYILCLVSETIYWNSCQDLWISLLHPLVHRLSRGDQMPNVCLLWVALLLWDAALMPITQELFSFSFSAATRSSKLDMISKHSGFD